MHCRRVILLLSGLGWVEWGMHVPSLNSNPFIKIYRPRAPQIIIIGVCLNSHQQSNKIPLPFLKVFS